MHTTKLKVSGENSLDNQLVGSYPADDIFQDIEGDPDNIIMNIPPEILYKMGWQEGDVLKIDAQDGVITITKKEE